MSTEIIPAQIEYRELPEAKGYRFGSDGTIWSRWRSGGWGRSGPRWPWRKLTPSLSHRGYYRAHLKINGKQKLVNFHTIILTAFKGPPPPGLVCRHWDDNRLNNRVENLFWGTQLENVQDQIRNGRMAIGERRNSAKFTEAMVLDIRRRFAAGEGVTALAREHGVNHNAIAAIVRRRTWKHVP